MYLFALLNHGYNYYQTFALTLAAPSVISMKTASRLHHRRNLIHSRPRHHHLLHLLLRRLQNQPRHNNRLPATRTATS